MPQLPESIESQLHKQKSGCWLWYGPSETTGYPYTRVGAEKVHLRRFVYELDRPKKKSAVRTTCGKVQCLRPEHLV